METKKTCTEKIHEAVTDLGLASPGMIMAWIRNHYPEDELNRKSYRSLIIGSSVNHSSSHHYSGMRKFLWFEKEVKKYRLASLDASTHSDTAEIVASAESCIDGIPFCRLSETGEVNIPSAIREKVGFQPGNILAFVINEEGTLEIRKARIRLEIQ